MRAALALGAGVAAPAESIGSALALAASFSAWLAPAARSAALPDGAASALETAGVELTPGSAPVLTA